MALTATKAQIAKVQTVYAQMARHEGTNNTRENRLAAAAKLLGRAVDSFSTLKRGEAIYLIDQWQGAIGVEYTPHKLPQSSEQARRAGLDGRKEGFYANAPQLVSQQELEVIRGFLDRLGWDDNRFNAFLLSDSSPIKGRNRSIRTTADANKVRWALKQMLVRAGKWEEAA